MQSSTNWHNDTIGQKVVEALQKNNFKAEYLKDRNQALTRILELIPPDASIGCGGSATNKEIGLLDLLEKRGNELIDWAVPGFTPEQMLDARRRMLLSDVFISGTNAITLDGQLVNVDGTGNRVAAITFGPKKVIIIAGINKITTDVHTAMKRIRLIAAPINNKRLERPNPCTTTGICMDCASKTRICNATVITHKCPPLTDITVFIIGEHLGY